MANNVDLKGKFILIVGGGKVGLSAFKYCKKKKAKILIVDPDRNCILRNYIEYFLEPNEISEIESLISSSESILIQGGIGTAFRLLDQFKFIYIFPTVPLHLSATFAVHYLTKLGKKIYPDTIIFSKLLEKISSDLIYNIDDKKAIATLSYMPEGLECKEKCSSPMVCPVTGIEKTAPLFEIINSAIHDFNGIVLESVQMEPGLGAIEGNSIYNLFEYIKNKNKFIITTASRCHGIINALKVGLNALKILNEVSQLPLSQQL
ncbi:MAG: NAD(P)-dependent oxidoreductase [Candidatus Hodarchaeota archaeon]